jgi:hypothetical protein
MMTKQTYVEYLLATPINYTCTNLAEHHAIEHLIRQELQRQHVETLFDSADRLPMR